MSRTDLTKGRYSESNQEYFVTFVCHNRINLFSNDKLAKIFCQTIANNENKYDCLWLTWVLMPDHFHGLLRLGSQDSLSKVVKQLKGNSARQLNLEISQTNSIWQQGFYDRALRKTEDRKSIARYIVANPLRKKIVLHVGDYPYWNSVYL